VAAGMMSPAMLVAHWDCRGSCGMRHIDRPEPNSSPEWAMDLLLEKAKLVFGEQDWSAWEWTPANTATASAELSRSSGMTEPGRGPIPARPTRG